MKFVFFHTAEILIAAGRGSIYIFCPRTGRMGHTPIVLAGPPDPWPMPWARMIPVESLNLWGVRRNFLPAGLLAPLSPLNFFEFAATRFGFFPEMFIFSLRAMRILRRLLPGSNFDLFHDVQSLDTTSFGEVFRPSLVTRCITR